MPELPEVETVKNTLKKIVLGKTIKEVVILYPNVLKNIDEAAFINIVEGQKINDIRRLGKYLFFDLDSNTIISHLRMEGKYNFTSVDDEHKHDIFYYTFTDQSRLIYNDTRKFGTIDIVGLKMEKEHKSISKLGLEPFDTNFTIDYLKLKAKSRVITVKQFLLDQTVVAGLGNIYVDEVLFLCKLHPKVRVCDLSDLDYHNIIENSIIVLNKAILEGGSTIKSFAVSGDVHGRFQHSLNVYNRKDQECYICNGKIKKIKVSGRGTHYCPNCQGEM